MLSGSSVTWMLSRCQQLALICRTSQCQPASADIGVKGCQTGHLVAPVNFPGQARPNPWSRLGPFQLLARNGDLEGADSGKAEPHARAVFDDGHQGVVAVRTAHYDSGTSKDLERPNLVSRAASVARLHS